jgi:hypothetical protein
MSTSDEVPQDLPLDVFIEEMRQCGFEWVKRIGHVNVHIFEHTIAREVVPIIVEGDVVRAIYVANARKKCRELRGDSGPAV